MPVELASFLSELEYSFQLLDLLRSRARRKVLCQTVLNEALTVLIANILHVDIAHARDDISHGFRRFVESRGTNLSLRAYETILKEVCQSHGYGFSNVHPQFQILFIPLTFCPALIGMTQ
jgi:hypothetical protein